MPRALGVPQIEYFGQAHSPHTEASVEAIKLVRLRLRVLVPVPVRVRVRTRTWTQIENIHVSLY